MKTSIENVSWVSFRLFQVLKEIQSKKEAEMVQKIIAQVKAECEAKGADADRRGYSKHYWPTSPSTW